MNLQLTHYNNETILPITLYGTHRNLEIIKWHKQVMVNYFGININYIEAPFPNVSHGYCMNQIISSTIDTIKPDYYWFLDSDAIILKKEAFELMYDLSKNKMTLFSHAWQSNHKKGPNGMIPHPYASQACLFLSSEFYTRLGRPDCDHWIERSDTAEEITYKAKEQGYIVSLIYPSHVYEPNTDLDNGCRFGLGNTYGPDLFYHSSQQDNPKSHELFIDKCKKVLEGKYA